MLHSGNRFDALVVAGRIFRLAACRDFGHRSARIHAGQALFDQRIAFLGIFVFELAQQPVLAAFAFLRLHADQQPFALHPFSLEHEVEVAVLDIVRALALDRLPGAAVPQHHRAAAIFVCGDCALEGRVVHRVILGPHREPLCIGIGRRALGNRPAFQHTVVLQPQVPVQPGRVVLLDHEDPVLAAFARLTRRLLGAGKIALCVILGEWIGFAHQALFFLRADFFGFSSSTDFFSAAIRSITLPEPPPDGSSTSSTMVVSPFALAFLSISFFSASA